MKSIYTLSIALCALLFVSCKPDASTQTEGNTQESVQDQSQTGEGNTTNGENNQPAGSSAGHDYTFLTNKILVFKNSVGSEKGEANPYKDQWIDLMPDGTFKAGKLKDQTHTGAWTYNHEKKILFIKPHSPDHKMSEWSVMHNEKMMVWVGTQTYGNNAYQIQMIWSDQLP